MNLKYEPASEPEHISAHWDGGAGRRSLSIPGSVNALSLPDLVEALSLLGLVNALSLPN